MYFNQNLNNMMRWYCYQYPIYRDEYNSLNGGVKAVEYTDEPKTRDLTKADSTSETAMRRHELLNHIQRIESAIYSTCPEQIADFMLLYCTDRSLTMDQLYSMVINDRTLSMSESEFFRWRRISMKTLAKSMGLS